MTGLKPAYLALVLVLLGRPADDVNLGRDESQHVIDRDVLHGAVGRVDLNVALRGQRKMRTILLSV